MSPKIVLVVTAALITVASVVAQPTPPPGWQVAPGNEREPGQAGYRILHPTSGLQLVYVPPGTFTMGSDAHDTAYALAHLGATPEMLADEIPAHQVTLKAYWIGRTEVTVGQWRRVTGDAPPYRAGHRLSNLGDDYPVVGVTFHQVQRFCARLSLRLPTEAEWEYAARGPAQLRFPWGNEWDETRCVNGVHPKLGGHPQPVGSLPVGVSWCGAQDLAGNVWEYCRDWYAADYYARSPRQDPPGPNRPDPPLRVVRGGSWRHDYRACYQSTFRRSQDPAQPADYVGFRVAFSP